MNPSLLNIIKIIIPIFAIINIALVALFFFTYIHRCTYHKLVQKIKEALGKDNPEVENYTKIFCDNSFISFFAYLFDNIFVYLINIFYCVLLIIAFINSLIRLCKKNQCCLICSSVAFLFGCMIATVNLIIVFCNLDSLEITGTLSDDLIKEIEDAYESVKDTRVKLILSTIFSLFLSILGSAFSYILFSKLKQEDNDTMLDNNNKMNDNQNEPQFNWSIEQNNVQNWN